MFTNPHTDGNRLPKGLGMIFPHTLNLQLRSGLQAVCTNKTMHGFVCERQYVPTEDSSPLAPSEGERVRVTSG